jgi:hypothetical protein
MIKLVSSSALLASKPRMSELADNLDAADKVVVERVRHTHPEEEASSSRG